MTDHKHDATFHPDGQPWQSWPNDPGWAESTAHEEAYGYDPGPAYQDEPSLASGGITPGGGPLPRRTPMDALVEHGNLPPDPSHDRMHYASPGPAPWAPKRGLPAWAWVSIVLGTVFLICGSTALVALLDRSGPVPSVGTSPALVSTTGTCEKKIIGEYGLVATIRATNNTETPQAGVIWVRWQVTGQEKAEYTRRVVIEPNASVEFPVNNRVPADTWYRTGACTFGWTGS